MAPVVFGIPAYPAALATAVVVGMCVVAHLAPRFGISSARLLLAHLMVMVSSLAGGRLHAALETGIGSLASFSYATRYPGCVAGCLVALPFACRLAGVSMATFADTTVVSSAVALAIFRVGCLLHGCCYGIVSSVPWAVRYPAASPAWSEHVDAGLLPLSAGSSLPVHPLPVYLGLWALALAMVFWPRVGRMRAGDCFLAFLVFHDGGKFLLEGLRAPEPLWHLRLPSLLVATGAGIVLASRGVRRRSAPVEGLRPRAIGADSSGAS
jgi:phosphatidylglycerol:prolipoprotein diacylglycerol transferase